MKAEIVLLRHGITEGNAQHMYYGSTDVSLTEKGREQLREQVKAGIYPDSDTAQFFTTGMIRTEQSLEEMYGKKEHQVIEDLRELDFGDFEMMRYEELKGKPEYQAWITAQDDSVPPPNGESIRHFGERVHRGFEKLKTENELLMLKLRNRGKEALTVCVCHGGVISAIMDQLWPGKCSSFYEWIPDPGHGYVLEVEDGKITGYRKI